MVAFICLRGFGPVAGTSTTGLPEWLFGLVWTGLHPCFGVATATVYAEASAEARRVVLLLGTAAFAVVLAFMPVTTSARQPWTTVFMDGLGWLVVWLAGAAYAEVSPRAFRWLLPLMVWMPVTFTISTYGAVRASEGFSTGTPARNDEPASAR